MSWVSPRMSVPVPLGTAYVEAPVTPPSVTNLRPSTCVALSDFKDLMRQYRSLDDGITTRMNRTFTRYWDVGLAASPTLLSSGVSASKAKDLGTSTYSTAPKEACAQFWRELVDVWIGREEAVRYCIAVAGNVPAKGANADDRLDADRKLPSARYGRGEDKDEFLARQLHNELAIESIIRKRSLDAFKTRCRIFEPTPQDDRELAMWEGRPTPAVTASARGSSLP